MSKPKTEYHVKFQDTAVPDKRCKTITAAIKAWCALKKRSQRKGDNRELHIVEIIDGCECVMTLPEAYNKLDGELMTALDKFQAMYKQGA